MEIDNYIKIKSELPEPITLVAVSKTQQLNDIQQMYNLGQRVFGENKVQELVEKYQTLPKDINWHFIGHLQTNKVKIIAPFISLIHSIDSGKLLFEVNKEAKKNNRIIDCLLQIYIAKEETKYGFSVEEVNNFLLSEAFKELENVRIVGVMGMATFTEEKKQVMNEFSSLKTIFSQFKENYFADKLYFKQISMGMSQDYHLAIEAGSTMVRIGTLLFGS
ncbi:MAG: YggS family pyridoxal phosphate-dependent enzyme [Bacteroidales bacterium]|nr:YggS family pyridoxal phosphate-dependent enzyme [Bacteroidales bacterium]